MTAEIRNFLAELTSEELDLLLAAAAVAMTDDDLVFGLHMELGISFQEIDDLQERIVALIPDVSLVAIVYPEDDNEEDEDG